MKMKVQYPSLGKHSANKLYPYLKVFGRFTGENITTVKGWNSVVKQVELKLN